MAFNTHRVRDEFVDIPGTVIDLTCIIYHENHNQYYFFTETIELKSAPLSTFPSSTKFVICKDKLLHFLKNKVEISEDESIISGIYTPNIRIVNESKIVQSRVTQIDKNLQP